MNNFLNNIFKFIYLTFVLAIATGCQKSPINGDLDGKWQIMEIETENFSENTADSQLYYNFSLHVCSLSYYGGVVTEGNFIYDENTIIMDFPYIQTPDGYEKLKKYGIYSNPVEFKVKFLDKKRLVVQSDESLITLRKF